MKVSGAAVAGGARTPGRSKANQENKSSNATTGCQRPSTQSSALCLLNVNAIFGRSTSTLKNRQSVKTNPAANAPNRDLSPSSPVASIGNDNCNGNSTVVWKDNVVFQREGECSVSTTDSAGTNNNDNGNSPSKSLADVSSNETRKGKEEHIHPLATNDLIPSLKSKKEPIHPLTTNDLIPFLESTPAAYTSKDDRSPGVESIASATQIPTVDKGLGGDCEESRTHLEDNIEEIEKEIMRLTEKLQALRLQQAAKERNQETQQAIYGHLQVEKWVAEGATPKKTAGVNSSAVDESQVSKGEEPKNAEKQRRGRTVSAKFLQWDSRIQSKAEKNAFETGKSRCSWTSPKSQRRGASLGPAEHLRLSEIARKGVENEHGLQNIKNGSGRKWCPRASEITRNAVGEMDSSAKYDRLHSRARSMSLSPVPQRSIDRRTCNLSLAGISIMSTKKTGTTTPKDSAKNTLGMQGKKLFQDLDTNKSVSTYSLSSKAQSSQKAEKPPSPSFRRGRFVPSRYGKSPTPCKDKGAQTPKSSLSSLRNVHGKRVFQEDEFESIKGRVDNTECKRRFAVAGGHNGNNYLVTNTHPGRSVATPRSRTPKSSAAAIIEAKKTHGVLSKDCKTPGTPTRHGSREKKNQDKECSNRNPFADSSDLCQVKSLEKHISGVNEEVHAQDGTDNYCFCIGTKAPDTLERHKMKLPKIKTVRFTTESPRDSGCIKREIDRIGKKSFFAPDGTTSTPSIDKGDAGKPLRRESVHEISHALSYEEDEEDK